MMESIELRFYMPPEYIANALSSVPYDDLIKLILQMDLEQADCGFTESLVKGLVKSLKSDSADVDLPFIDWEKV